MSYEDDSNTVFHSSPAHDYLTGVGNVPNDMLQHDFGYKEMYG